MKIRAIVLDETNRSLKFEDSSIIQRDDDVRVQSVLHDAVLTTSRNVWIRRMYLHQAILFGAGFFGGSMIGFLVIGVFGFIAGLFIGFVLTQFKIPFGYRAYILTRKGDARALLLTKGTTCPKCDTHIRGEIEPAPYPADVFKKALKSRIARDTLEEPMDITVYIIIGLVVAIIALAAALVLG